MTCPHATNATIAYLYGEGSPAHAAHVAACPDCLEVVADHEGVTTALGPALGALRASPSAGGPVQPRRRWGVAVVCCAVAMAAAALFVVGIPPWERSSSAELEFAAQPAPEIDDRFDAALDDLDDELTTLELELL